MTQDHDNKIITQEDVARQAGVSRSIVSYVINNGPRKVSEETRFRVLSAIKELGYRPNKHAQMLSSTDDTIAQKYIGIILAGNYMFRRTYYGSILASIHERAHERDWRIRFIRVFDDFNNPALFNELIHPNEINGVILVGLDQVSETPNHSALIQAIVERVPRVVCVEWEWPGIPSIQFDRQKAAYQATHHLLESDVQRIAYIGPKDKRVAGYQQALWEKNMSPDRDLIYEASDIQSGHERCKQLIQSGVSQAILAGTDEVAVGILKCLHQHHFAVPGDVAVASIDNIDISAYTIPALTTVDVPKYQIGLHAIDLLVSDEHWKQASAFALSVPTQLIVRESSVPNLLHDS
ncbi:MAG TPA: LacI family DNA-binding transcriptional regulator [Terriglobales bacterium]|nr:LacI family DNA-binding transcriptional regulator [Terriglobales bacterium]